MFCCACNIEEIEDTENEGIELGTFSDEKDKSENIEIDDVSTKRKRWYLDRSDIDFRNEKRRLEQKNLDDVRYLKLNLDDVRYLKWHDRSKRTLVFLESQFMSEIETKERMRAKKKKKKKKITLKKDPFLDKLQAIAEKVEEESESIKNRADNTADMERRRRLQQSDLEKERVKNRADAAARRSEQLKSVEKSSVREEEKVVMEDSVVEERQMDNVSDKDRKERREDKAVQIVSSSTENETIELVEVEPVWVSGGPLYNSSEKKKRQPKEIGGFLSDLRSLHLDDESQTPSSGNSSSSSKEEEGRREGSS